MSKSKRAPGHPDPKSRQTDGHKHWTVRIDEMERQLIVVDKDR